jgi:hypothetical protein
MSAFKFGFKIGTSDKVETKGEVTLIVDIGSVEDKENSFWSKGANKSGNGERRGTASVRP